MKLQIFLIVLSWLQHGPIPNSKDIVTAWEAVTGHPVSDKRFKSDELKKLLKKCGLATSFNKMRLRQISQSLKRTALPLEKDEVNRLLVQRNEPIKGFGVIAMQIVLPLH
jgi:hypothetical protein